MICPKCGKEIPKDALFCEFCFAEIRIVPEFDSELQEQLTASMEEIRTALGGESEKTSEKKKIKKRNRAGAPNQDAMTPDEDAEHERRRELHDREVDRVMRRLFFAALGFIFALILVVAGVFVYRSRQLNSASYFVGRAYSQASKGNYGNAAEDIDHALGLMEIPDLDLMLTKAEYLQKAGKTDESIAVALEVAGASQASTEQVINAYEKMISVYRGLNDYSKISELLSACDIPEVLMAFQEYRVFDPVFTPEQGYYSDELTVTIDTPGNGTIFYTMDGTDPTTESMLYNGKPLVLSQGRYRISAIYVNHFGMKSTPVTKVYTIE